MAATQSWTVGGDALSQTQAINILAIKSVFLQENMEMFVTIRTAEEAQKTLLKAKV